MTIECPDEIQQLPSNSWGFVGNGNYWTLDGSSVYHQGNEKQVHFNTLYLKVGDTIGCSVHKDGTLHFYVNGIDTGISYDKLPTNYTIYGFADVCGHHKKIRSLFYYSKYTSVLTRPSYDYMMNHTICMWFINE